MRIPFLKKRFFVLFFLGLVFSNCAGSFNSNLEAARFELDAGNYDAAIEKATNALAASPGNVTASRILASAYFGRSGIDYLDLASEMLELQDSEDPNFQVIANVLPTTIDLEDLRSAIETLEALDGIDDPDLDETNEELADAAYDLATMQGVESFAIGAYNSGFLADAFDVTTITDEDAANVLDDLVDFDNRLIASGIAADETYLSEIRQAYCLLKPLSVGEGFTTSEYQVLVGCQLADDPSTFDTVSIDADIPNCDTVNPEEYENQDDDDEEERDANTAFERCLVGDTEL